MDNINQERHRQAPKLQDLQLHGLRHDHQNMSRVNGIVLHSLQHHETLVTPFFTHLLPDPVSLVGIMVADQHTIKSLPSQDARKFLYGHFAVQGTFLCVTMHIKLHFILSFPR